MLFPFHTGTIFSDAEGLRTRTSVSVFRNNSAQLRKCGHVSSEIHDYVFPFGEDKTKHNEIILVHGRVGTMAHFCPLIFFL